MQDQFRTYFLFPYLILLVAGLVYVPIQGRNELVLILNEHRSVFADVFFRNITHLGDGIFLGVLVLVLLVWRWRVGVVVLVIGLVHSGISSFLKKVVFGGTTRPTSYYYNEAFFNYVPGVEVHGVNSFPSGHTMTAFAVAAFFSLYLRNKWVSQVGLLLAVLTGISRIYLLQHFLFDVLAGSMLGILIAYVTFRLMRGFLNPKTQ